MKILAVNGSPRVNGNTAEMIKTALEVCEAAGHETEIEQVGGKTVRGCVGCGGCGTHKGKCAIDDWMNELYPKMKEADAIVLGSPTYFADLTPELKAVIDRCGSMARKDGMAFSRKTGAAVGAVRRAGAIHTLDSIGHFFLINDMIVLGSSYWNLSLSRAVGDYGNDAEGIDTMKRLGENIVWLLEKLY
jgi:multimeric flavodoxin WrbA